MPNHDTLKRSPFGSLTIDESGPGSILKDFDALLGFIGTGVRATGKHHLLPIDRLFELDALMTRPLCPPLQRPQQKSFPHINGLYMLLRATQMAVAEGQGASTGRLTLDPAMLAQWRQLNATERYFNLLEAWLRISSLESIGFGDGRWAHRVAGYSAEIYRDVSDAGIRSSRSRDQDLLDRWLHSADRLCLLALFELFGLMTIERAEPAEGKNWNIQAIDHTRFGDAVMQIVSGRVEKEIWSDDEESNGFDKFGVWKGAFRRYFPQWVNNLHIEEPVPRDGQHLFKVSWGKVWRKIEIPATLDLDALAQAIIGAFNFDGDHLYGFKYLGRNGRTMRIERPEGAEGLAFTDEIAIGELPLTLGQSMVFEYDYGAGWQFDVKLEKIGPPSKRLLKPKVIASHGEAPPEYGDYSDW
jgi:Plasmid pRiA4b ORF-3-like protein